MQLHPVIPQDLRTVASPTWVGATLSGLTAGSVLFAGTGGIISQDNAGLFWNNATNLFGINDNTPDAVLKVAGTGLGTTPGLKVAGTDDESSYVLNVQGHSFGNNHVQVTTGTGDSRLTFIAGLVDDFAPRVEMVGAEDASGYPGFMVFDYGSDNIVLSSAEFRLRWMEGLDNGSPHDVMIAHAKSYIKFTGVTDADILFYLDKANKKIGIGEDAPETLTEWTDTAPYLTLHNSTHEDIDGGRESRLIFKGEQSGGEETSLAQIEASHDGAADDQLGKMVFSVNTGAGLAEGLRINSNADVDIVNDLTAGTIQADNGFTGSWVNNEGDTVTVVGGIITGVAA